MVDNAGNEILSFGSYGNFDSQYVSEKEDGKTPLISSPAVPLAWPLGAGFSQTKIYVADMLNRRVVRMAIKYDVEAICKSGI